MLKLPSLFVIFGTSSVPVVVSISFGNVHSHGYNVFSGKILRINAEIKNYQRVLLFEKQKAVY